MVRSDFLGEECSATWLTSSSAYISFEPLRTGGLGSAATSLRVYSCWGELKMASGVPHSAILAFMEDADAVAESCNREKVVGDIEDGASQIECDALSVFLG